ncbi:hypothetical protein VTJ83DRAFT_1418 [Remersonia thermophila]|uniref:Sorting nexin MVP1 n=1 Tax=Remersonia thermophila TaxID=72144 RepID=A0ABR4DNZ5_9PEZI
MSSLFGDSSSGSPELRASPFNNGRGVLFEDEPPMTRSTTTALFADDDPADASPWDIPAPRKQQSRAELIRSLLPSSRVPESYIAAFDAVLADDHSAASQAGRIGPGGLARTLAAARLPADTQAHIMAVISAGASPDSLELDRNQFNVLLALIGLAQEGEPVTLDGVDERRRSELPTPDLHGLIEKPTPPLPHLDELAAKPPQRPVTPPRAPSEAVSPQRHRGSLRRPPAASHAAVDYPEDPWNTPDVHRHHNHAPELPRPNGHSPAPPSAPVDAASPPRAAASALPRRTTSAFTTSATPSASGAGSVAETTSAWAGGFYDNNSHEPPANPFGGVLGGHDPVATNPSPPAAPGTTAGNRTIGGGGRSGMAPVEEHVVVTLMPEKEGMFLFQHHNYEVTSTRRGSKVVRRYSDFVWLLDCLHKRYPFRVLPLLPPKRVAVNGNHLSNDGAFIEKRRRGLARFLNSLVGHPVLSQEQLVVMFLTVPTELSVWRKQATISVQDEFAGRPLPPGLEDSLPPTLEDLFSRTRAGVKRSAELYINVCNLLDRLVKRTEGVAADHARLALSLISLTDASADTYATDPSDVPLLNDGLQAMSRHLRQAQGLMEDEARAWDQGVLEDLKRQRDALVSLRDLFDRRERLDKDNIPYLEKRIAANEQKLAGLRAKPEGMVKPGEIEKVVEAIIKDKQSIVEQHNRSVFVRECLRDELIYFQHTQYHVSRWNQDWAQERVKYSEMLADNWRRLLDGLEGMPLGP